MNKLAALCAMTALALASPALAQDKVQLKLAVFGPVNAPTIKNTMGKMVEDITARSNGAVSFEVFGAGSPFAAANQIYAQVERGVVDMGFGSFSAIPGRFPLSELIALPFTVNDHVAASRALARFGEGTAAKEHAGVQLLHLFVVPPSQIHLRKPATSLDDLKGMRIMSQTAGVKEVLEALGAQVAAIPTPATYENLQKGTVDGSVGTWSSLIAFRVVEVTTHHIATNLSASPQYFVMNKAKYASLPPAIKALVDEYAGTAGAARNAEVFALTDKGGLKAAQDKGHTITVLTPAERQAAKERLKGVNEAILAGLEEKGVPARASYAELTKLIAEEEKKAGGG